MEVYHTLEAGWTKKCQMLHFVPLDLLPLSNSPITATARQGATWTPQTAAPAPPAAASVPAVRGRLAAARMVTAEAR